MTALSLNSALSFHPSSMTLSQIQRWFKRFALALMVLAVLVVLFTPEVALAGSDSTFRAIVDWVVGILKGSGGLLIATIALVVAVISLLSGKFGAVGIAFAVAIVAIYGPDVLESWFTAVF